ncbi:MAG: GNAT family N-acetyltransferase [Moheibacter sp.]
MNLAKPNVHIRKAVKEDRQALEKFNDIAFPDRKGGREFLDYRNTTNSTTYIVESEEKVVGIRVMLSQKMIYKEKLYNIVWSTDTFLIEEYRGMGLGKALFQEMVNEFENCFTLNTGEKATTIYLKNGFRKIGLLRYFFRPLKIRNFINFTIETVQKKEYKNEIQLNLYSSPNLINGFRKIENVETFMKLFPVPDFSEKLQAYKDKSYIEWRYFYKEDKYFIYAKEDSYFIFRTIFWKGMKCIMLVDFLGDVGLIYKSLKKIARINQFSGILWASSELIVEKFLRKKLFINYHSTPIISNIKLEDTNVSVAFHFSDSDLDFNYSNTPFIYL